MTFKEISQKCDRLSIFSHRSDGELALSGRQHYILTHLLFELWTPLSSAELAKWLSAQEDIELTDEFVAGKLLLTLRRDRAGWATTDYKTSMHVNNRPISVLICNSVLNALFGEIPDFLYLTIVEKTK